MPKTTSATDNGNVTLHELFLNAHIKDVNLKINKKIQELNAIRPKLVSMKHANEESIQKWIADIKRWADEFGEETMAQMNKVLYCSKEFL